MNEVIEWKEKPCIELEMLDCNCTHCIYMKRDLDKWNKWMEWHKAIELDDFEKRKAKAIADALAVEDESNRNGMLRVANKMRFEFDKSKLLGYGDCLKFDKPISFIPLTCQLETQNCFKHRKDV